MWEDDTSKGRPGLATLYLEVMDLLYSMEPNLLYFVQASCRACAAHVVFVSTWYRPDAGTRSNINHWITPLESLSLPETMDLQVSCKRATMSMI